MFRAREYRTQIPAADLQEFLEIVRSANISALGGCEVGVDGVSYQLSIEDGAARALYRWGMNPKPGWAHLTVIANALLQLGCQVSGQYLT